MCAAVVGMGATFSPLLAVTADQLTSTLTGHILPPFLAIKWSTPAMVDAGGGSICCISSTSGHMAMPYFVDYAVAKAGVEMLVRGAAEELGHLQVRVNAIRPGLTHTQDTPLWRNEAALNKFREGKPLGRLGEPDDIGAGVRYLLGPESSWVTGQSFAIDGGHELRAYPRMVDMARGFTGGEAFDAAELRGEPVPEDRQVVSWLQTETS
jgi:NAD(P)-dependent dehydrogenase (short-subunit alcohol dehydrogenase family)